MFTGRLALDSGILVWSVGEGVAQLPVGRTDAFGRQPLFVDNPFQATGPRVADDFALVLALFDRQCVGSGYERPFTLLLVFLIVDERVIGAAALWLTRHSRPLFFSRSETSAGTADIWVVFGSGLALLGFGAVDVMHVVEVTGPAEQCGLRVADIVNSAVELSLLFGDQLFPLADLICLVANQIATASPELALAVLRVATDMVVVVPACDIHCGILLSPDPHRRMAGVVRRYGANRVPSVVGRPNVTITGTTVFNR
jgi:hypothetical protein